MHLKETDMFTHAIVRRPGENFADGITTSSRGRPVYTLLMKQHSAYVETLASLGLEIIMLDALLDYPDLRAFSGYEKIIVKRDETYACNTLLINNCLITPRGFPDTRKKLEATGYDIIELDVSEAQKMDGGLTCMSIRL
ncbi:MAG: hypothetical protein ABII68_01715 [Pseudomonadota bacterium]